VALIENHFTYLGRSVGFSCFLLIAPHNDGVFEIDSEVDE